MRHVYANRATYILATTLVIAVLLFGWLRSRAVVIETENDAQATAPSVHVVDAVAWAATTGGPSVRQPLGVSSRSMSGE